jgi:hypothetical protein
MPNYITQYGLRGQQEQKKEPSELEKKARQINWAQMTDEQALGMALGMGLRYLWDQHLARRHAKQDAAEAVKAKQNNEVQSGNISDIDAFRKANGNLSEPTLNVPENWNGAPAETGGMWEKYAVANGVPGSRDYQQESIERVMPTPQLNAGALTTDDLVAALADPYKQKQPFYFGGGF